MSLNLSLNLSLNFHLFTCPWIWICGFCSINSLALILTRRKEVHFKSPPKEKSYILVILSKGKLFLISLCTFLLMDLQKLVPFHHFRFSIEPGRIPKRNFWKIQINFTCFQIENVLILLKLKCQKAVTKPSYNLAELNLNLLKVQRRQTKERKNSFLKQKTPLGLYVYDTGALT